MRSENLILRARIVFAGAVCGDWEAVAGPVGMGRGGSKQHGKGQGWKGRQELDGAGLQPGFDFPSRQFIFVLNCLPSFSLFLCIAE